jgi:ferritin
MDVKIMISQNLSKLLNQQIGMESQASNIYLAMASWAEVKGYDGISKFFYMHSDEERQHMLKLFHYINERGGHAVVPPIEAVSLNYPSVQAIFESLLEHEVKVSAEINKLVDASLTEKDYTTHNFLQWYVSEQMEEERLARTMLDKLKLIGTDTGGLYLFDRECGELSTAQGHGAKAE